MQVSGALARRQELEQAKEAAILAAALELLIEVGYDAMTFDELARRAHVSKATLYNRWRGKAAIVPFAIRFAGDRAPCEVPDTGSVRDDLVAIAREWLEDMTQASALLLALIQAVRADATLASAMEEILSAPARDRYRLVLQRAVDRGEIAAAALEVPRILDIVPALGISTVLFTPDLPLDVEGIVDHLVLPALHAAGTPPKKKHRSTP